MMLASVSAMTPAKAQIQAQQPQTEPQQIAPLPLDTAVRYGVLDNGLTYYIRHNEEPKERCDFHIAQAVGATLEKDDQNGLAHFLEHMAFNGTEHFPDKTIIEYFESVGVKFGSNINAYTSTDETVYRLSDVPTYREAILDSALLVMHDWSCALTLSGKEIDNERGVIREEWRTVSTAARLMFTESNRQKYPGTPYATRDVIGDTAVINNFSYQALRDYYHQWYGPDLQCIVVVGDIDVDRMEQKLIELFSPIPERKTRGIRPTFPLGDNDEPIVSRVTNPEAQLTIAEIRFKLGETPKSFKRSGQGYQLALIHNLFEMMMNYRMQELTMNPKGGFSGASISYGSSASSGVTEGLNFLASAKSGREAQAFEELATEAERFRRYGFTTSEFERARTEILSRYEQAYNERNTRTNRDHAQECYRNYLEGEPMPGIEWEYETMKQLLPMLSVGVVNQVMMPMVTEKNVILAIQGAEKEGIHIPTKEEMLATFARIRNSEIEAPKDEKINRPLVEHTPTAGTITSEETNEALGTTEWVLSNGAHVVIKPTTFKNDEIRLFARSKGGLDKVATADLSSAELSTAIVQFNGLGSFDMSNLQKVTTGKRASVKPQISERYEMLTGSSTVKDFETMLQLLYLHFTATREDDEAFANIISLLATSIKNKDADHKQLFADSVAVTRTTKPERHLILNEATLAQVSQRRALELFRERFANAADFTFYLVGNIDPKDETTRQLIAQWIGGLATTPDREQFTDTGARTPQGKITNYFARKMEINTATNRIYYTAPMAYNQRNSIIMHLIGDILSTRYLEEIREKEGGSYGVGCSGTVSKYPVEQATLSMGFDTDPEKQQALLEIIHREIDKIAADGPIASDFDKAKQILAKAHKENMEKNPVWINALVSYYENQINLLDYQSTLDAITPSDIQSTLKALVDAGNVIEVVMTPQK